MTGQNFHIKVSDLLKSPGKKDEILFEKKSPNSIKNLTKNGISGNIKLWSLNKDSIDVVLENINCETEDICDTCLEKFTRKINIENYESRFIIPDKEALEQENEEVFFIQEKSETIDIEQMLTESIVLQEPLIKKCEKCEKSDISVELEDDENLHYFENTENIRFISK